MHMKDFSKPHDNKNGESVNRFNWFIKKIRLKRFIHESDIATVHKHIQTATLAMNSKIHKSHFLLRM